MRLPWLASGAHLRRNAFACGRPARSQRRYSAATVAAVLARTQEGQGCLPGHGATACVPCPVLALLSLNLPPGTASRSSRAPGSTGRAPATTPRPRYWPSPAALPRPGGAQAEACMYEPEALTWRPAVVGRVRPRRSGATCVVPEMGRRCRPGWIARMSQQALGPERGGSAAGASGRAVTAGQQWLRLLWGGQAIVPWPSGARHRARWPDAGQQPRALTLRGRPRPRQPRVPRLPARLRRRGRNTPPAGPAV